MHRIRTFACLVLLTPLLAAAQDLAAFEKRVTEFTLANGMHFILVERHEAPVVSFHTYVKVGSLHDPSGRTGLAHMFEHMAFKGTPDIGSKNWVEEKKALDAVEEVYDRLEQERRKGPHADRSRMETLQTQLKAAIDRANLYVEPNVFPRIIEENGGVGLNAGTGLDSTNYFFNLPANRAELWFLLESQRFLQPVFREFYKERDVVLEERRQRIESSPQGKLSEMFLATAFAAHPYRQMPGGWASDIESLRVTQAREFYKTYYVPGNITVGIAGDITGAEARRLADRYFSRLPSGPLPPPIITMEPKQEGPKRVEVQTPAQPLIFIGYKRPDQQHKDDPVFDVVATLLSSGRTGSLYKEMVRDKKLALAAIAAPTFPGGEYPNLFAFLLVPAPGKTIEENEKTFYDILERFKKETVDAPALARVKTKARAGLIRQLDSNSGLASLLPSYHVAYGNWRKLFTALDDINKVTAADAQRVAREYFVDSGRTLAVTVQTKPASRGAQ